MDTNRALVSCFIELVEKLHQHDLIDIASDIEAIVESNVERIANANSVLLSTQIFSEQMRRGLPDGFVVISTPRHLEFIKRNESPMRATLRLINRNAVGTDGAY